VVLGWKRRALEVAEKVFVILFWSFVLVVILSAAKDPDAFSGATTADLFLPSICCRFCFAVCRGGPSLIELQFTFSATQLRTSKLSIAKPVKPHPASSSPK
jgi:hypothetical protein